MFVTKMNTNLKILLIEDDADDIELLEEAFRVNGIDYSIEIITEGDKVAPFVSAAKDLPEVIVLDFNLPRVHGKEILKMLKSSSRFSEIPVIVLTTSAAKEDVEYALTMGADHFITKPTSLDGFTNAVNTIAGSVKKNK
ncbi:MAG: response regulator [Ferruginibacter sp.]